MKLQDIFENMKNNNICVNLDDSYCSTSDNIKIKPDEYIGCIYSISNIEETMECINEEGSAIITYCFYECAKLFKNKDIFTDLILSFFNNFNIKLSNYETNQKKIEIVITSENLPENFVKLWSINNKKEESDDDYVYSDGEMDNYSTDKTEEETEEETEDSKF